MVALGLFRLLAVAFAAIGTVQALCPDTTGVSGPPFETGQTDNFPCAYSQTSYVITCQDNGLWDHSLRAGVCGTPPPPPIYANPPLPSGPYPPYPPQRRPLLSFNNLFQTLGNAFRNLFFGPRPQEIPAPGAFEVLQESRERLGDTILPNTSGSHRDCAPFLPYMSPSDPPVRHYDSRQLQCGAPYEGRTFTATCKNGIWEFDPSACETPAGI